MTPDQLIDLFGKAIQILAALAFILFGTIGGFILGWLNYRGQRKMVDGQVANQVSEAWQRLNKPLEERIDELIEEQEKARSLLVECARGIQILINQLETRGIPVEWIPPQEMTLLLERKTEPVKEKKKGFAMRK